MVNIYLDDCRKTPAIYDIRTYTVEETIDQLIKNKGNVEFLSLDNDLGEGLAEGYKVLDWLEEEFYINNFPLPKIILVHSANSAAMMRMNSVISKLYKGENK